MDRLPITPEMLAILIKGAGENGEVTITRPRHGTWPEELRLIRLLEKDEHLRRVSMTDTPANGFVTATYAVTATGRRVASDARDAARPPASAQRGRPSTALRKR